MLFERGSVSRSSDRFVTALAWFLLVWAVFLVWHYASTVLKVRSVPEFLGLTLLATVLVVGVPGALLAHLERRRGRRIALSVLLVLGGAPAAYLAAASGVAEAAAATLFLLAAAYGFGTAVAGWAGLDERQRGWQGAPLAVTVGLAVLVVLAIWAGGAGVLVRPVTVAVGAFGIILAGVGLRRLTASCGAESPPEPEPVGMQWWWGWIVLVLIGLVGAVAPEIRHDALAAHLPIAREFAVRGAIVEMRQNMGSYFPLNGTILYALGMTLVAGEAVPKLLHFSAGVLSGLLTYDLGARLWQPRVGLAAAAVVASTPLMLWVGGSSYTDLWIVLFVLGAAGSLLRLHPLSQKWAMIAGLLAGAAVGVKVTAFVVVLPMAALVLMRPAESSRAGRWRVVVPLGLGFLLGGSFWYCRAWLLTGNPVFPMLNAVFKSPYWDATNFRFNMDVFGMGTGLRDALLLPWRITFHPQRFVESGDIGVAYLFLLPVAMLAAARRQVPVWMWGGVLAAGLLWFLINQYVRYFLLVLPFAALAGAAGLLADRGSLGRWKLLVASLALGVTVGIGGWIAAGPSRFPIEVALGRISRTAHVAVRVAGYSVAEYAQHSLPRSARIYGVGVPQPFYYDRYFVSSALLGRMISPALRGRVLRARSGAEAERILSEFGYTHAVVNREHDSVVRRRTTGSWASREAFWEEGPRLEFAYREYYLFGLGSDSGGGPRVRGRDLLQNGGMSGEVGAPPAGWDRHGPVSLEPAGPGIAGTHARIAPSGYIVQRLTVTPDRLYVLEAEIRGASSSTSARLFIQWFDKGGRVMDYTTWRQVTVGPGWTRYAMACAAPRTARSAQVWLIAAEGGDVEFDNAAFYELR
ncbi:MAG: glycosyltransferase family 39 protein [bacterium]|nr:glycosyltransferase family 39 protein [bacterium]